MKLLFVRIFPSFSFRNCHPQHPNPPLSIGYCISLLRLRGHTCSFIDILQESNNHMPRGYDVVFIDTATTTFSYSLDVAKRAKDAGCFVVMIGQHAHALPDTFLFDSSPVDACVVGELEISVLELVENLERLRRVKGLVLKKSKNVFRTGKRPLIKNINNLPFPSHGDFEKYNYGVIYPLNRRGRKKWGFILSSRGCPYHCIYCSPTLRYSFGKKLRCRSSDNILSEMKMLSEKFKVNSLYFKDDTFLLSRKRVMSLCDSIISEGIDISWVIQSRVDHVERGVLKRMRKAGCSTICFGVESGSNRILQELGKDVSAQQIRDAFKISKELGFLTVAYFMLGNPTEKKEDIMMSLKLCAKLNPDMIQVAFFTPYPGSPAFLMREAKEPFEQNFHYLNPSLYKEFSKRDLIRLQKRFYRQFYAKPSFIFKYLKNRLPDLVFDFRNEYKLLLGSLKYFR